MKLKIWNPYGIGISNFEFHQNPRTFIFWDKKRGVFDLKNNLRKKKVSDFDETQNLKSLWHRDFKFWVLSKSEKFFFVFLPKF